MRRTVHLGHVVILAVMVTLFAHCQAASDDDSIRFDEFSMSIGDRIEIGSYIVELVDIQSVRDGLTVVRVSRGDGKIDEQRVQLVNSANKFDGGSENRGLTITVVNIYDDESAKVRLEFIEDMGTARKKAADKSRVTRTAPNLVVTKSFDQTEMSVGDDVKVTISVKNIGTDTAFKIALNDQQPFPDFVPVAGYPPRIKEELGPGESDLAIYVLESVKKASVKIPPTEITYYDSRNNLKSNSSESFIIVVNPPRRPNLEIVMSTPEPIKHGELGTVYIRIKNTGQASAYRLEVRSTITPSEGLKIVGGSLDANYFEIPSGGQENYSAQLKGERSGNYSIVLKAGYQSGDSMMQTEKSATISVLEQEYKYLYYLLVIPMAMVAVWVVKRYREYKY